jgi:hypothetical protein
MGISHDYSSVTNKCGVIDCNLELTSKCNLILSYHFPSFCVFKKLMKIPFVFKSQ